MAWAPSARKTLGPLDEVAIAGIATTRMAWKLETTTTEICLEAARGALADAGLSVSDVDGISARWSGPGGTTVDPGSADWANLLGIGVRWIDDTYPEGVPGVLNAAAAIRARLCRTVLIVGGQAGVLGEGSVASYTRPRNEFVLPFGSSTPAQFALVAQRYLHRFPGARERIAAVAATIRNMGALNRDAVLRDRGPYTAADVLSAPPVAEPLTRLDVCLANEGAAAMVVTSIERARECPRPPVVVLGGAMEWARQEYVEPPRYDEVWELGRDSVSRAFGMAGIGPQDCHLLSLYDPTSFEVVRQLEVLGFCGEGEGADFAADVGIDVRGGLPVNPDGGLLSYSHIGLGATSLRVIEAVRQLRGEAGDRQVQPARIAAVTGAGSGAQYWNLLVLAKG